MLKKLSVFCILALFVFIRCNEDEDVNDVFVPSNFWQTVKKGQKIPKGLHVRINLETGQTEAKLLEEDESSSDKHTALSEVPQETEPEQPFSKSVLPETSKNLKDDLFTPEDLKTIKDKFRNYDDIKKSLGELNLSPKMDAEVIADLVERHRKVVTTEKVDEEDLLNILEDLDYLAHQYDNAHEFVKQNGFHTVIYTNLNSSLAKVRRETLKLMGALMQNNVAPKIHALETGAVATLLRLIDQDANLEVKQRALTALGALLRSFPAAQKKFIETGGLEMLSRFFETDNIKIQIRLVTMISDLVVEQKFATTDDKLRSYYPTFDLATCVVEHDWCKKLNKLLLGLIITDKNDHDSMEKCLTAMHSVRGQCSSEFEAGLIRSLKKRYHSLAAETPDDDTDVSFFAALEELCDEILYVVDKSVKTEL